MKLLYHLFELPLVGSKIKMTVAKWTGGMQESSVIRAYTKSVYKVDVGMYSYGGCFLPEFNNGGSVSVGRYCSFASNIRYFGANHPMNCVSMSPYFYNPQFTKGVKDVERTHLMIGHDCWIGYGVIITSKCTRIGNGAVIAAGSVVTRDVPPYAVVAGVPAKVVRYRFDEKTIAMLEDSRWWEKTPEECLVYYEYMNCPEEFCRRINNVIE